MDWSIVSCIELLLIIGGIAWIVCLLKRKKSTEKVVQTDEKSTDQPQKDNKEPHSNGEKSESKSKYSNKMPEWAWILIASIVGAIVFIFVMILFQKCYGFEIKEGSTSIVLTFVGIAATFVVVSNYAQVWNIERKFYQKTEEVKTEFDNKISFIDKKRVVMENYNSFILYYSIKKYWLSSWLYFGCHIKY
jgi:hypothetical protein